MVACCCDDVLLDTKVVESPALRVSYDALRENDEMW
jgi:hypothetical protein